MTTKPKTTTVPAKPEPFKPTRFMFVDATSSDYYLCLGTEKLGADGGSSGAVPDTARGKIALCFGTHDYGDFNCEGHLTRPQVDRLVAFLLAVREQLTLEEPVQSDGATIVR